MKFVETFLPKWILWFCTKTIFFTETRCMLFTRFSPKFLIFESFLCKRPVCLHPKNIFWFSNLHTILIVPRHMSILYWILKCTLSLCFLTIGCGWTHFRQPSEQWLKRKARESGRFCEFWTFLCFNFHLILLWVPTFMFHRVIHPDDEIFKH